jgi:hypothetical protein
LQYYYFIFDCYVIGVAADIRQPHTDRLKYLKKKKLKATSSEAPKAKRKKENTEKEALFLPEYKEYNPARENKGFENMLLASLTSDDVSCILSCIVNYFPLLLVNRHSCLLF